MQQTRRDPQNTRISQHNMRHWLFKTEPNEYSIDDLAAAPEGVTRWDGIRNYQARNLLRDEVQIGDQILLYHSSCKPAGVAGIARVVRSSYPDPAQFDVNSPYFDAKASLENPRWFCVDIRLLEKFPCLVTLQTIKNQAALANMTLVKHSRLSIQPVSAGEWQGILVLSKDTSQP